MRHITTEIKTPPDGLVVCLSLKHRQGEWEIKATVPWKWLAVDEVLQRLEQEMRRQGRGLFREERPTLPLEKWE